MISASNIITFKVIFLSVSFLAGDSFHKCLMTVAMYLNTPFIDWVTKTFVPNVLPPEATKVDNALLIYEYEYPFLNNRFNSDFGSVGL